MSLPKRFAGILRMILLVSLLAFSLCGCRLLGHGYYDLVIENHTQQTLTVNVLYYDLAMQPCSVVGFSSTAGPRYGMPIRVEAQNTEGALLYAFEVKQWRDARDRKDLVVRIPPNGIDPCPSAVQEVYLLKIDNAVDEDLVLYLWDRELGLVERLGTATFGPLPGVWLDAQRITIRDTVGRDRRAEGQASDLGLLVRLGPYTLGLPPEVSVTIKR